MRYRRIIAETVQRGCQADLLVGNTAELQNLSAALQNRLNLSIGQVTPASCSGPNPTRPGDDRRAQRPESEDGEEKRQRDSQ